MVDKSALVVTSIVLSLLHCTVWTGTF